ncbi:peroxisomal membrane protein 13-like [Magnolia sinica]|uniref:peroxisomal membrane protein 13-like n=1 Tax=Magnolia sinica TaxID=86752 RepID=UPI002658FEDA|nr:peroxisomal membrane protein 13-like [Magnolia sinica]
MAPRRRQQPPGNTPSGPSPYKPPSADGSTSNVVEASGAANHGESVSTTPRNGTVNRNALGRPLPTRNWERNYINNYGGYGGFRGPYGGRLYGNNMYRGPPYTGYGMYGTGMYNNGYGGPVGGYHGMSMGGQNGDQDPNNPSDPPPPGFWMSFLGVVRGAVMFLGRISILIDQNTQAFHMLMSALLQVFDTSGILYGELASFVFRLLGIMPMVNKARQLQPGAPSGTNLRNQNNIKWPKTASNPWDNIWGDGCSREK